MKGKGVEIKKGPKELGREKLELETVKTQSNSELEEIPLVIPLQVDPTQRSISQRVSQPLFLQDVEKFRGCLKLNVHEFCQRGLEM